MVIHALSVFPVLHSLLSYNWNIMLLFSDLTKELKRPQILFMDERYRNA